MDLFLMNVNRLSVSMGGMTGVLLTRPVELGRELAAMLAARGYDVWSEPVLTILPTGVPCPSVVDAGAVMFTSQSAARMMLRDEARDLLGLPCFCVGPRTAEAARHAGFANVVVSNGDGVDLAQKVVRKGGVEEGKTIVHICGQDIAGEGSAVLRAGGFRVVSWPVYQAREVDDLSEEARTVLGCGAVDVVLFFSSRTASHFMNLVKRHALEACCRNVTAIGLSEAVAGVLLSYDWNGVEVAMTPTEEAMIARLESLCPPSRVHLHEGFL